MWWSAAHQLAGGFEPQLDRRHDAIVPADSLNGWRHRGPSSAGHLDRQLRVVRARGEGAWWWWW